MNTWEERARTLLHAIDRNGGVPHGMIHELVSLLAEPPTPTDDQCVVMMNFKPGDEIPGWAAAWYASNGRAKEVEWHFDAWQDLERWELLSRDVSNTVIGFFGDTRYRFRLRPAPPQYKPGDRVEAVASDAHEIYFRPGNQGVVTHVAAGGCWVKWERPAPGATRADGVWHAKLELIRPAPRQPEPAPDAFEEAIGTIRECTDEVIGQALEDALRALADQIKAQENR